MMFAYQYDDVRQECELRRLEGKPAARIFVLYHLWKRWDRQRRHEFPYAGVENMPGRFMSSYRCAERSEQRRLVLAHVGLVSVPQRNLITAMLGNVEMPEIGPLFGMCRSWAYQEFGPACRAMRRAIRIER